MATVTAPALKAGFTLLEILVVMLLIGIVAGAVGLSVSGGGQLRARAEAERLQDSLRLAADEAVFQDAEIGVQLTGNSYRFLRYDASANVWRPMPEAAFRNYALPDNLSLALVLEGKPLSLAKADETTSPAIIMLSTGEATPFSLTLSAQRAALTFTLASDGIAPVSLREDAAHE